MSFVCLQMKKGDIIRITKKGLDLLEEDYLYDQFEGDFPADWDDERTSKEIGKYIKQIKFCIKASKFKAKVKQVSYNLNDIDMDDYSEDDCSMLEDMEWGCVVEFLRHDLLPVKLRSFVSTMINGYEVEAIVDCALTRGFTGGKAYIRWYSLQTDSYVPMQVQVVKPISYFSYDNDRVKSANQVNMIVKPIAEELEEVSVPSESIFKTEAECVAAIERCLTTDTKITKVKAGGYHHA